MRALDEDENWRERTEVITKHDHNLNKQLARDIVEQIVDSAARWENGELRPERLVFLLRVCVCVCSGGFHCGAMCRAGRLLLAVT